MKITILLSEVRSALIAHYGLPDNTEFEILRNPAVSNMLEEALKIEQLFPGYRMDQKIAAIKHFRMLVPGTGLFEAKTTIENWDTWKSASMKKGDVARYVNGAFV